VSQDCTLFSDTLDSNVHYDRSRHRNIDGGSNIEGTVSSDDNHRQVAVDNIIVSAHLNDFISSFPDGLQSKAGGKRLAGLIRTKNCTTIACGLLKDALVLILDEIISSLNTGTEE